MKNKAKIVSCEVSSRRRRGGFGIFLKVEKSASICGAVDLVFSAVMQEEKEARRQW